MAGEAGIVTNTGIWQMGAVETAAAIRARRLTARAAVEAAIERMRAVNASVNAVTMDLSHAALAAADRADAAQAKGDALGALHGVPVTVKENVDQKGLPNTNGVAAFADKIAPDDSAVVSNLLKAGAIVIGRTNTPEFSLRWFTENPLRGRTLNPWNRDVTPGGSSGGAAASVALGIGAIAHGNDLGGSLRYPAFACGVATIRPSLGRVPAFNPGAGDERPPTLQLMSVQGPIARSVRDVRLGLAAMAAEDHRDPWWVPAPLEGPALPQPIRVAVTKIPAGIACHPAVAAAIDEAASHLADAGYEIEAVDPPLVAEIAALWRMLLNTDLRNLMRGAIREYGSDDVNRVIDDYGHDVPPVDLPAYARALADRTRFLREWNRFLERYPLVLAPVSQMPPFPQGEDRRGIDRMRKMLDEQSMLYAVNLLGLPASAVPTGFHDGVPIGVQIVGPRFREDLCLDAAQAIEDRVGILAERLWAKSG
jgi:amidase